MFLVGSSCAPCLCISGPGSPYSILIVDVIEEALSKLMPFGRCLVNQIGPFLHSLSIAWSYELALPLMAPSTSTRRPYLYPLVVSFSNSVLVVAVSPARLRTVASSLCSALALDSGSRLSALALFHPCCVWPQVCGRT